MRQGPGSVGTNDRKMPKNTRIMPATPAIPKPGRTNSSTISSSTPRTIKPSSPTLANPVRYGAPTKIARQISATNPGTPTPGV